VVRLHFLGSLRFVCKQMHPLLENLMHWGTRYVQFPRCLTDEFTGASLECSGNFFNFLFGDTRSVPPDCLSTLPFAKNLSNHAYCLRVRGIASTHSPMVSLHRSERLSFSATQKSVFAAEE
jgi:hypothetical protein